MRKESKLYAVTGTFEIAGGTMPDGVKYVFPVFTNKKKAEKFQREHNMSSSVVMFDMIVTKEEEQNAQ